VKRRLPRRSQTKAGHIQLRQELRPGRPAFSLFYPLPVFTLRLCISVANPFSFAPLATLPRAKRILG